MKFNVDAKQLRAAVDACKAPAGKLLSHAAGHVLVTATDDGTLTVAGISPLTSVSMVVSAEVVSPGSMAIDAKELSSRLAHLPGEVTVAEAGGRATLKSGKPSRQYRLAVLTKEALPPLPSLTGEPFTIAGPKLVEAITRTQFSMSTDETRPHLASMLLVFNGASVRAVTTDGHRLSMVRVDAECADRGQLQVSRDAVVELLSVARTAGDGDVTIGFDDTRMTASSRGHSVFANLPQASFPPYEAVIPERDANTFATVDRSALIAAISAASVVDKKESAAALTMSSGGIAVSIVTGDGDFGETVSCEFDGAESRAGANARYMLEPLRAVSGDNARLSITGDMDPIVVRDGEGDAFIGVIMPCRI